MSKNNTASPATMPVKKWKHHLEHCRECEETDKKCRRGEELWADVEPQLVTVMGNPWPILCPGSPYPLNSWKTAEARAELLKNRLGKNYFECELVYVSKNRY